MPSNRGRVEDYAGASERGQPRAFRIPLVPADQSTDLSNRRIEGAEAQIPWCEVVLLKVGRIIRDVHFAIDSRHSAFAVYDYCAVVIEPGGSTFKDWRDDGNFLLASDSSERFGRFPGHRLCKIEECNILALAKILRTK